MKRLLLYGTLALLAVAACVTTARRPLDASFRVQNWNFNDVTASLYCQGAATPIVRIRQVTRQQERSFRPPACSYVVVVAHLIGDGTWTSEPFPTPSGLDVIYLEVAVNLAHTVVIVVQQDPDIGRRS